MAYKLSKRSLLRLENVHPFLLHILIVAIKESPIDFGIPQTGGYRSPETQHELFLKGVSKCDGYRKKSKHQTGRAFDIYAYENGKANWNIDSLTTIAKHILNTANQLGYKLEWGGTWKSFQDLPHFQLKKIK